VVDYASPSSLESALKGIDVVISTLGGAAIAVQEPLSVAAKAARVDLFVPSEFGGDTRGVTEGFSAAKHNVRQKLEAIGLPSALFFTGPFSDWIFEQTFLGFDIQNGKIEVGGDGDALCSFTSRRDIARYLVHVLLTLPTTKLHNGVFKIEGDRTSINRVMEEYQARTGKKVDITRIPDKEVKAAAEKGDLKAILQLVVKEQGLIGTKEEVNTDWPEFYPQTAVDAILA